MKVPSLLRDVALVLLAVATVAAAAYLLLRDPARTAVPGERVTALAQPSAQPSVPPSAPVQALFVGGDLLAGESGLADLIAQELDWDVTVDAVPGTGYVTGEDGQAYGERTLNALQAGAPQVVVLLSSTAEAELADPPIFGGTVQRLIAGVRRAAPDVRIVLVGPVLPDTDDAPRQREVLTQVAARFGAFFLDPTGRGYVEDRPDLLTEDGSLTAEGAEIVARRVAADLRVVLPPTLVPSAGPSPARP